MACIDGSRAVGRVSSSRALNLSGIPDRKAGTQPPSCIYLDNRLCMNIETRQIQYHSLLYRTLVELVHKKVDPHFNEWLLDISFIEAYLICIKTPCIEVNKSVLFNLSYHYFV